VFEKRLLGSIFLQREIKYLWILEVKRQEREADHSLPSGAEVKNNSCTFTPLICLHDIVFN
jgi:hypothetical protein